MSKWQCSCWCLTHSWYRKFQLDLIFDITLHTPAYLRKVLVKLFLQFRSRINFPFFLRCQNFIDLLKCLMNELDKIDSCILTLEEKSFNKLLLYRNGRYDRKTSSGIILASIKFIYSSKRFEGKLMWWKKRKVSAWVV